jgi:hypothetical protein
MSCITILPGIRQCLFPRCSQVLRCPPPPLGPEVCIREPFLECRCDSSVSATPSMNSCRPGNALGMKSLRNSPYPRLVLLRCFGEQPRRYSFADWPPVTGKSSTYTLRHRTSCLSPK